MSQIQPLAVIRDLPILTEISAQGLVDSFFAGRKQTTIDAYTTDLDIFAKFCGLNSHEEVVRLIMEITHSQANLIALRYRAHMIDRKLSASTVNRRLAAIRSVCKLANRLGKITWTISVEGVKPEKRKDVRGPGLENVQLMIDYASKQKNKAMAARDVAIITLFIGDGIRRNELLTTDYEDFDFKAGTVSVLRKGKTEKTRLPISPEVIEAIKAWIKYRGIHPGPVFTSKRGNRISGRGVYHIVQSIGKKIGIKVRPHGFRHTFITEADKAGNSISDIQAITGHSTPAMVSNYLDDKERMARKVAMSVSRQIKKRRT